MEIIRRQPNEYIQYEAARPNIYMYEIMTQQMKPTKQLSNSPNAHMLVISVPSVAARWRHVSIREATTHRWRRPAAASATAILRTKGQLKNQQNT